MILTIWRHGEAGRAASDFERELTDQGTEDVGFACRQFREACLLRGLPDPDRIWHSPWRRTCQTADIVAAAFSRAEREVSEALQPGSDVDVVDQAMTAAADQLATCEHLLLVSHQPLVSWLLDYYLGAYGGVPPLSPGGLATLSMNAPAADCGRLLFWALPPAFEAQS